MRLSPHEQERLLLSYAAELARRRRQRGLVLNHPEAVASSRITSSRGPATAGRWRS